MTRTYELETFLGEPLPVELVTAVGRVERTPRGVSLHCRTGRWLPEMQNYYGTDVEAVFPDPEPGEDAVVRIDVLTSDTVRLRYAPGPDVPEGRTPMVVGTFDDDVQFEVAEDEARVTLDTGRVRVVVEREPFRVTVLGADGDTLWRSRPVDIDAFRRVPAEEQWHPTEQRWIFHNRYAYPLGCVRHGDRVAAFVSFDLHHEEHVYGLGEDFGPFSKRGTRHRLWLQEAFSNTSPASYKQVPFHLSTRGYGLFVNTSNAVRYEVGSLDHTAVSVVVEDTPALDLYLIHGPSVKEILPRYTAITGRPAVPPRWSFGLWMARITYRSQEEVERVARELREHRIPCDVIHIDTGWFEQEYVADLKFSVERFPDVRGMFERLREQGFHVSLWQWPNFNVGSPLYMEGLEHGYLGKRLTGHVYTLPGGYGEDAGFIDYSNPEAVRWIQGKFAELFDLGAAAIKVDYGEGAPPDAVYAGVPGTSMHNLYPLLYGRAVWEATEAAHGPGGAVLWARSAWAGSQRYPVHWSGDGVSRYEDLAPVLRSTLGFGLSGFPFYSHDIGGFSGLPSSELYVRWAQLGLLSSHARTHGVPPREPWAYGDRAEALFRQADELRYRLLPYLWSEAVAAGETSMPIVRPLVLDFQDDPTTHVIEDQYLLGPSLLVAPVLDERLRRRLYLPAGGWVDHRTGELLCGPRWLEVDAPLDVVPIYVRAGAVLPLGPVLQHVAEGPLDPLTLELYAPGAEGGYVVRGDGTPDIPVGYRREAETVIVTVGPAPGRVEVVVIGLPIAEARIGGTVVATETVERGTRVVVDGRDGVQLHLVVRA